LDFCGDGRRSALLFVKFGRIFLTHVFQVCNIDAIVERHQKNRESFMAKKHDGGVIVPSALEEDILTLLMKSPQGIYGLDILGRLNTAAEKVGRRNFGVGSLYPALKRMEQQGLVAGRWGEEVPGEESGGARRRYYSISAEGKKSLEATHEFRNALALQQGQLAAQGV